MSIASTGAELTRGAETPEQRRKVTAQVQLLQLVRESRLHDQRAADGVLARRIAVGSKRRREIVLVGDSRRPMY